MLNGIVAALMVAGLADGGSGAQEVPPPNIVLILVDDLGYGDLSVNGHPTIRTPRIDALAQEGRRFSQFVMAASVCTPSRAALLTGCYPRRLGLHESVIFPESSHGLHPDEVTLAEQLGAAGYATGIFGKWHLGHRAGLLPTDQGFDEWFGLPYSNDMAQQQRPAVNGYAFRLPLMRDREVIEWEPDQRQLTARCTDEAVRFIDRNAEAPFFLYLSHPMPHVPLYASAEFEGTSLRGRYGDVVEELDASVGRVVDALERHDLTRNTLVLFTSDNGPWLTQGDQGGSAGPFRDGKATHWEGGHRVPMIARWPGVIPAGSVCRELVTCMDWFPTIASLCGTEVDEERVLDGHDIRPLLSGAEDAASPTESFLYYRRDGSLSGVRQGPWKLLLGEEDAPDRLFHLERDIGEAWDLVASEPERAAAMHELALRRHAEIEAAGRPAGRSDEVLFDPRKPESFPTREENGEG